MTKQRLGFLLAITSILITGSAIAQTKTVTVKPPTIPCVDAVTGAVKIKNKCNTRLGEYVLNVAQLLSAIPDSGKGAPGGVNIDLCRKVSNLYTTQNATATVIVDCNSQTEYLQSHGYIASYNGEPYSLAFTRHEDLRFNAENPNIPTGVMVSVQNEQENLSGEFSTYTLIVDGVCCPH
jgi:hypothetical protein